MSFGEYSDFDDCISKNKDKDSPEAYCADVHKKITGKWPGEKERVKITTSGSGNNVFLFKENQPTVPPKAGYKWKQGQEGGWYQVKAEPSTATPKDAEKYLDTLQRKILQTTDPLKRKELEDEMKYVIQDIKKMKGVQ